MIHLVYPFDTSKIAAPWSIGNHLAAGLRKAGYQVQQHQWDEALAIQPAPEDIIIGHPHPDVGFAFRNSVCGPWAKTVAISPWNGSDEYFGNLDYVAGQVDHLLCICGEAWKLPWENASRLDMAVEPEDFRQVAREVRPAGQRRFLYIGCTLPIKGPEKIAEVAQLQPVGHAGYGTIPGCTEHGYLDFSTDEGRAVLEEYDFLITLADHDANPTTVLEAMSWGLVPLCSPGSGYTAPDVVVVDSLSVIEYWQNAPVDRLLERQKMGFSLVRDKYTWERFTSQVLEVIK